MNAPLRGATRTDRSEPLKPTEPLAPAPELTLAQQSAVDLLASGKTDTETAELLKLHRVTVTRWRLYSPEFRAALAVRRANVWGAGADRLRALIPRALDVLAQVLEDGYRPTQISVALALLKLAGPLPLAPADPTDPEDYVRQEVERERSRTPTAAARILARVNGYRDDEEHAADVRAKLARLSAEVPAEAKAITAEPPDARQTTTIPADVPRSRAATCRCAEHAAGEE